MDETKLRASVAKFAKEVNRLRESADRLRESGWLSWVPARRGEMHGLVAEALRGEIIRATKLEGERGDLMSYSSWGDEEPTCDADGHTVWATQYTGFQIVDMEVQVFILDRATKDDTVAMLRKMADWLEDDWENLTDVERYTSKYASAEEFCPRDPDEINEIPF